MTKKPRRSVKPPAKTYQRTEQEERALDAVLAREKLLPRWKVKMEGKTAMISPDHPDSSVAAVRLMEAIGTESQDFFNGISNQIGGVANDGKRVDEDTINFMWDAIKGLKPRDEAEAMLATQMAAVHLATMTFARRLNHVENIPQQDSAERAFNKLARTFTTQMTALKNYRTGGQQKMTVEHVHVHDGGQAIVGSVTHEGGGATRKSEEQPHEPETRSITNASGTEMPGHIEAERATVPSAGGKG